MLYQDVALLFTSVLGDAAQTCPVATGHGRLDRRPLTTSTDLIGSSDWPALAHGFHLTRTRQQRGQPTPVVPYGIPSLPAPIGTAARLLARTRGHGGIEHGLP